MYVLEGDTAASRNEKFAKKLFNQPEFTGIEGSADSVRQMFDNVKKKIMSDNGWGVKNGGVTTNLSNKAGELGELEKIVKEMSMQLELLKETARLGKELKKDIEDATVEVLPSANVPDRVDQARKKRVVQKANGDLKVVYDDPDNESTDEVMLLSGGGKKKEKANRSYTQAQPAFDVRNNEVNNWLYTFMNPSLHSSTPSTITTSSSSSANSSSSNGTDRVMDEIEKHLVELGTMAMFTAWGIKTNNTIIELFDDVSVPVLLENFTPHSKETYITHLTRCGIEYLHAIKIWKGMLLLFSKFNV